MVVVGHPPHAPAHLAAAALDGHPAGPAAAPPVHLSEQQVAAVVGVVVELLLRGVGVEVGVEGRL